MEKTEADRLHLKMKAVCQQSLTMKMQKAHPMRKYSLIPESRFRHW